MDSTSITKKTAVKMELKTDSSNTVTCEEITTEFAPVKSGGKDTSLIIKQTIKRTINEKKGSKTQVENKETEQNKIDKHATNDSNKKNKETKIVKTTPWYFNSYFILICSTLLFIFALFLWFKRRSLI